MDNIEKLIKEVYRSFKSELNSRENCHPDCLKLACFCEGKLDKRESALIKEHLFRCDTCSELFELLLKSQAALENKEVPQAVLDNAAKLILRNIEAPVLDILLLFARNMIQLLNTSGDTLYGGEFIPEPVLRGGKSGDLIDHVTIVKDFLALRLECSILYRGNDLFDFVLVIKDKDKKELQKDVRITLIKDNLESESCLIDTGRYVFERLAAASYTVNISTVERNLAIIHLDITSDCVT